jgi:integrase/recombinase XerD
LSEADTQLLDAFCDALWLEDGLARNTISSYRSDLEQLASRKALLEVQETDLFGFLASRKGRASSAARLVSSLKRFYQYCLRERRIAADPTLKLDPPKRVPRFPKTLSETDVEAARRARCGDPARTARPRDAGDALRHRPSGVGAGGAQDFRGEP